MSNVGANKQNRISINQSSNQAIKQSINQSYASNKQPNKQAINRPSESERVSCVIKQSTVQIKHRSKTKINPHENSRNGRPFSSLYYYEGISCFLHENGKNFSTYGTSFVVRHSETVGHLHYVSLDFPHQSADHADGLLLPPFICVTYSRNSHGMKTHQHGTGVLLRGNGSGGSQFCRRHVPSNVKLKSLWKYWRYRGWGE